MIFHNADLILQKLMPAVIETLGKDKVCLRLKSQVVWNLSR
jgi:hypothetical protein